MEVRKKTTGLNCLENFRAAIQSIDPDADQAEVNRKLRQVINLAAESIKQTGRISLVKETRPGTFIVKSLEIRRNKK